MTTSTCLCHFPDGNAGIARALVRAMVPGSLTGDDMVSLALGRVDLGSRVVAVRSAITGVTVAVVAFVVSRSFTEQPCEGREPLELRGAGTAAAAFFVLPCPAVVAPPPAWRSAHTAALSRFGKLPR